MRKDAGFSCLDARLRGGLQVRPRRERRKRGDAGEGVGGGRRAPGSAGSGRGPRPGRPASRALHVGRGPGGRPSPRPSPGPPCCFQNSHPRGRRLPPRLSALPAPRPETDVGGGKSHPRCRTPGLAWRASDTPAPLTLRAVPRPRAVPVVGARRAARGLLTGRRAPLHALQPGTLLREAGGARPRGFPLRRSALLRKCRPPAPGETGVLHPRAVFADQPDHNKGGARLAEWAPLCPPPRPSQPSRHPHSAQADDRRSPRPT